MFLEIIDYKLKNRIYHKVEHAVKDFRCIIQSARLYHQVRYFVRILSFSPKSEVDLRFLDKTPEDYLKIKLRFQ